MARVHTLGATAIAAAITTGVVSLEPVGTGAADLWSNRKAVSEEQLENMRGGFQTPNGLKVEFGIERAILVNGELVAATRVVVSNLPNLLSGGSASAQEIANAVSTVVQNGPGNSVEGQRAAVPAEVAPSPAAVPTSSTTGAAAASATGASTSAAASATGASTSTAASATGASTSTAASATGAPAQSAAASSRANQPAAAAAGLRPIQVNGQTVVVPTATSIVTAVQNSLNNQVIQTRTSIDATMNSLSFLRSSSFADSLRQQTLLSTRR